MGRLRRHWIRELQWFAKAPHHVPPLTFIQLWSCQIITLFQQHCISPTELLWCNFSLKTDYLQGCGAPIVLLVPALPVEHSDIGRKAAPCTRLQLARSPSSLLFTRCPQSHEDLFVQRSEAIHLLAISSLLHCKTLCSPSHLRRLNVHALEASFILSKESVTDPC